MTVPVSLLLFLIFAFYTAGRSMILHVDFGFEVRTDGYELHRTIWGSVMLHGDFVYEVRTDGYVTATAHMN